MSSHGALEKAVLSATDADAILASLGKLIWFSGGKSEPCPEERIPATKDLTVWLPDCPLDAFHASSNLAGGWDGGLMGELLPPEEALDTALHSRAYTLFEVAILHGGFPPTLASNAPFPRPPQIPVPELAATIEAIHRRWLGIAEDERNKHPLGPIVRSWQDRPLPVSPDTHERGILPLGLLPNQPHHALVRVTAPDEPEERALPRPGAVLEPEPQVALPFAEATAEAQSIPRAAPLLLAEAAGIAALQPGKGARLDKRLLIFSLLDIPRSERRPGGRCELRPTVRDLVEVLWPAPEGGCSRWRPSTHGEALLVGLDALSAIRVQLPEQSPHLDWAPAMVRARPDPYNPESVAVIEVALPESCDRGPLIYRPQLIREGVRSDPAFDLWIGLAYIWDQAKVRNGGHRIYATRPKARRNKQGCLLDANGQVIFGKGGRPETRWDHKRAVLDGFERNPQADKVPWLDPSQMRRLAYGGEDRGKTKQKRSRELIRAKELFLEHQQAGRVVIETDGPCWRILEAWPG